MSSDLEDVSGESVMPEDTEARKLDSEVQVLLEEYKQLSAQAGARYALRYSFHGQALILIGALATLHGGKDEHDWMLLVCPTLFVALVLLMLKQHAYVDLRNTYVHLVLRPRLSRLLAPSLDPQLHVLGWTVFEQSLLRGHKRSALWLQPFAVAEYILPVVAASTCLALFVLRRTAAWAWPVTFVAIADGLIILLAVCYLFYVRRRAPHLDPTPRQSADA